MNNPFNKPNNLLPSVTPEYWQAEFTGAYGSEEGKTKDWDGASYTYWNNLLNFLAIEGEAYL